MIVNRLILNDGSARRHISLEEVRRLYNEKALGKNNLLQQEADGKWVPLHTAFDTLQWDLDAHRFRVIRADGSEELGADVLTIRGLYERHDLALDSMVFDNADQKWLPLRERFDIQTWGEPDIAEPRGEQQGTPDQATLAMPEVGGDSEGAEQSVVGGVTTSEATEGADMAPQTAGGAINEPSVRTTLQVLDEDRRRKVWAAWLLFLCTLVNIAWTAFLESDGFVIQNDSMAAGMAAWNLIVAVGLVRGGDGWRTFACFRAWIGILYGLSFVLDLTSYSRIWYGCFNSLWCIGCLVLLMGTHASHRRRKIGAWMMAGAQFLILAVSMMTTVLPEYRMRAAIRSYSVPDRSVSDSKLGYTITIPAGWTVLKKENPIVKLVDAKVIAVNVRSGAFAAFLTEPAFAGIRSADEYLDQVEQGMRQQQSLGFAELGRSDIAVDGRRGRKANVTWRESGEEFQGSFAVVRQGWFFYSLRGWCTTAFKQRGTDAVKDLQEGIRISTEASEQFAVEVVKGMQAKNSLISDHAGAEVLRIALARTSTILEIRQLLEKAVEQGRPAMSKAEQSELDDLYSRAFSALPPDDNRTLLAYYAKVEAGTKPNQTEAENADALVMKGVNALPSPTRLRFRAVFSRMIEAGLNRLE